MRVLSALRLSPLWIEVLVVVAWLGLLVHSHIRFSSPIAPTTGGMELLTAAGEGPGAEWMGVYLEGQKIGCGLSDTLKTADGYRLQERTYLRLRAFDQEKDVTTVFVARTDLHHRLRAFSFLLSAPPSQIDVRGEVRGAKLEVEIHTGGGVETRSIPIQDVPDIALTFKDRLLALNPKVGDTLEVPYFDPATMSQQKLMVKVTGAGQAQIDGISADTLSLEASYSGFKSSMVVTRDGRTLEETNALGMKLKRENREQAILEGWSAPDAAVDIISLSAVPVKTPLENARKLTYLDAHLSGGGVEVLLGRPAEGARPGDVTIRIVPRDRWKAYQIPMVDARFTRELEATPLVQKDDPKIVSIAQSIIGDTLKADDAAALLNSWVHERLRKAPVMGVPSALDVLSTGEGDCNEHTTLFTALARAVGIPTRMAAGIVYSEDAGGGPAFYYHAWPEIYLGEWVAIDPTFGQFPADATHIKLVEGDLQDQLSLLRVVGNLQLEIKESH